MFGRAEAEHGLGGEHAGTSGTGILALLSVRRGVSMQPSLGRMMIRLFCS
jgi:hypothetical protein